MDRRSFLQQTGLITVGWSLADKAALAAAAIAPVNKLPKWKGFNLLDFYIPDPTPSRRPTTEEHFSWMRDWGFDFIRIPIAYPHYLKFDRGRNIRPEEVYQVDQQKVEEIQALVAMGHKYGMHVCLNLHRAPGYCINAGFHEPYNLWTDQAAQDAFCWHWNMWAKAYKNVSRKQISFDLLNEPSMRKDMNDQHSPSGPVPGEVYRKVAKAALEAIRKENPDHLVIADGNSGGNSVIPELMELDIAQSCRGYYPHAISHYKAPWANKDPEHLPEPLWPGQVGNQYLSRPMLEAYYRPWIELMQKGVGVHCGEAGCWKKTPHGVFIAWFSDVLEILSAHQIGFATWNFIGDFGILDSGREDVAYEDWHGHKLDRELLELMKKY
ncbi:cellulase family glycosylhydrolase [Flavitalea sp. BT771]|uniref:glycoside hydrolase family 5 protein n=1 Tax=Flavitalea sp. BT771 TaxID=3063329 RepID=UPI0026E41C04|nr:cellulase family glycosylhydrolase [Flavitalea sp. BT771]MDO6433327.1 cellulase family glycosylhydrolase [Flavitalea sp. BT771]MDV6222768.1 cellulase family glycosylhydrolase [Flavitalea sp. BT771]